MVEELLAEINRLGVVLVANDDRLQYYPRAAMTPELIERLREHKAEVLAVLHNPWPADDSDEPDPCPRCGGLAAWETITGRWRCMKCDPPTKAIKVLERVERIRRRYGLENLVGINP